MDKLRVLVVDGSTLHRNNIVRALETLDAVEVVGSAPNAVILDASLPDMEGLVLFAEMGKSSAGFAAVMTADHGAEPADITLRALEQGVLDFITKPAIAEIADQFEALRGDLKRVLEICRTQKPDAGVAVEPVASTKRPDESRSSSATATGAQPGVAHSRIELVAIGISTGGPKALGYFIPLLPATLRVPIVVVQHMPAQFTKTLTDSLAARSDIRVVEGGDAQVLEPGTVYFAPGGRQMKVVNERTRRRLVVTDDPPENHCRPAVDYLLRSVAQSCGAHALGVIMTGMGADGCAGLKLMKQRGAWVVAQDEESSLVFGMPQEAMKAGVVDEIVGLDDMANTILRHVDDA